MRRTPLGLLLALAALAVALGGLRATSAAFTDGVSTNMTLTTGSVAVSHDGEGLVFTSAPMAPGDVATAAVRVANTGSLAADLSLARDQIASTSPGGCAVRDALHLKVVEDLDGDDATTGDRRDVADEPLKDVDDALALGKFLPAAERSYELTVTYVPQGAATSADNDNCAQGSVATERLSWQAVEVAR